MSITLLAHAGGSPGVTTTALAVALSWPSEVLLCDCDPHANQTILAGYLQARSSHGAGLASFAAAVRSRTVLEDQLRRDALPLTRSSRRTLFYPGFSHPTSADIFAPLWPDLADQFRTLSASGTDVLVDLGRLSADPVPASLLTAADRLLLVTRSDLPALADVRIWLPLVRESVQAVNQVLQSELVLVGAGQPYWAREISYQFDVPVVGEIAWDPKDAAVLRQGHELGRNFARRPLFRSAQQLAHQLFSDSAGRAPSGSPDRLFNSEAAA